MHGRLDTARKLYVGLLKGPTDGFWTRVSWASDAASKPKATSGAQGSSQRPSGDVRRKGDSRFDAEGWWTQVDKRVIPDRSLTETDSQKLASDASIAKEYSRRAMRAHRKQRSEESVRLKLKLAALNALPAPLRDIAQVPDFTPFPLERVAAALTPPVTGFTQDVAGEEKKKEKRR